MVAGAEAQARAVFLEHEENSGRTVSVMQAVPAGCVRSSFQSQGSKRRPCRVLVNHRRSWSVGGSNVHQTMMRRSDSHLRRLELVAEQPREDAARSTSSMASVASTRRCSVLVDAERQTEMDRVQRSKGDGFSFDSPSVRLRQTELKNSNSGTLLFIYLFIHLFALGRRHWVLDLLIDFLIFCLFVLQSGWISARVKHRRRTVFTNGSGRGGVPAAAARDFAPLSHPATAFRPPEGDTRST